MQTAYVVSFSHRDLEMCGHIINVLGRSIVCLNSSSICQHVHMQYCTLCHDLIKLAL